MTPDHINPAELSVVLRAFRGSPLDVDRGRGVDFDDPAADHWDVSVWNGKGDMLAETFGYELFTSKPDALEQAHRLAKSLGVNVEVW